MQTETGRETLTPLTYTPQQLMALLQLSRDSILRLGKTETIPGRVCRRPARWGRPQVNRWVEAGCPGLRKSLRKTLRG